MSSYTIPALPNSIAVSLQPNLLDYLVELKFLLLFFERPYAVLSTSGFDFINPGTVEEVKKGNTPRTNLFDEQNLRPLGLLATEEWAETLAQCESHEFNMVVRDDSAHVVNDAVTTEVDHIFEVTKKGLGLSSSDVDLLFVSGDERLDKTQRNAIERQVFLRLELSRFLDVLALSRDHNVPMIWSHTAELVVSNIYTEYQLLSLQSNESFEKSALRAALRMVKGGKLLREVYELQVVNLATVPVASIVDFRSKNQDLLANFLTIYRAFLAEVQANPADIDSLVEVHAQRIVEGLNAINNEIALRRKKRGYEFMRGLAGDNFFDAAMKCAPWGLLSFLLGPWMQFLRGREAQLDLLYGNSTGYLWKAKHNLTPPQTGAS